MADLSSGAVTAAFGRRVAPASDLADRGAEVVAAAQAMATRFHRGGKLVAFGTGSASTDAQHVAVEFVHPVIVGKRALPAICLTSDAATVTGIATREGIAGIFAHQITLLAGPADIALGISVDERYPSVLCGLRAARDNGLLTIALVGHGGGAIGAGDGVDHVLAVRSADPRVIKEVQVTTYHLLWELVHVCFEQPGLLAPGVVT